MQIYFVIALANCKSNRKILFCSSHLDKHPAVGAAEVQQVVGGSQVTLRLGRLIVITIIIILSILGPACPMNCELERELRSRERQRLSVQDNLWLTQIEIATPWAPDGVKNIVLNLFWECWESVDWLNSLQFACTACPCLMLLAGKNKIENRSALETHFFAIK